MTNREILRILKETVGYEPNTEKLYHLYDTVPKDIPEDYDYLRKHYRPMREKLESLPWISVKDYLPKIGQRVITLEDCNEHEVTEQVYDGTPRKFMWCPDHICHWMPIPEDNDEEITYKRNIPFIWVDKNE